MFPILKMCRAGGVHVGFLRVARPPGLGHRPAPRAPGRVVEAIFEVSDQTYGHRRVHAQLARQGEACSLELVRAIMRERGLVACLPRP